MKKILFSLVLFYLFVSNCFSYVLVKTIKGDEIYGTLVSENAEQLTIKTQKGDVNVKKTEIKSVIDFEQKDSGVPGLNDNQLNQTPRNKLSLINAEIFKTEERMEASKFKVYTPLILASLGVGIFYYIDSQDNEISPAVATVGVIALTTSIVMSGMGFLEYWDMVNTAAELRAKKYDIMNLPFKNKEPLALKIGYEFNI